MPECIEALSQHDEACVDEDLQCHIDLYREQGSTNPQYSALFQCSMECHGVSLPTEEPSSEEQCIEEQCENFVALAY